MKTSKQAEVCCLLCLLHFIARKTITRKNKFRGVKEVNTPVQNTTEKRRTGKKEIH